MTSRPSTAAPILAVLAIVLVTLGAYVGGYFWLGRHDSVLQGNYGEAVEDFRYVRLRIFPYRWLAVLYYPAVVIEAAVTGTDVRAYSEEDWQNEQATVPTNSLEPPKGLVGQPRDLLGDLDLLGKADLNL